MAEPLFPAHAGQHDTCGFEEMNLRVGARVELQCQPASLHPRLFTTLLGYAPGESVLVRTPHAENGLPILVQEGQPLIFRVFAGTRAYGFHTQVQRACIAPFLYLHLDFPREVQYVTVRKTLRLPVRLLAEAKGEGDWQPVMLRDLGVGGALLESGHGLGPPGSQLALRFEIPVEPLGHPVRLALSATLLEARPPAGEGEMQYGLLFDAIEPADALYLQNFLCRLQVEPAAK